MSEDGLIVVGSGPAGVAAAESFREHNTSGRVRILTTDRDLPYARPPLSKEYLRGQTDDVGLHPQQWFDDKTIELVHNTTVDGLDLAERSVRAGDRRFRYDALILACGAAPVAPPMPGGARARVLRSLADAAALREAAKDASTAVVIGAGFIGCEAAASLALRGMSVTLVAPETLPQEARLGSAAAERLRELVIQAGARYVGGVNVEEINDVGLRLDNGVTIDCDLILAATGVTPQHRLAADAGLDVRDSRVVVDTHMSTSTKGVYAAGDVALARHAAAGRHLAIEHWQDATDQGAIAGTSAAARGRRGMACQAFGAPSAKPRSSTTPGATATNAAGCSATPRASPCGTRPTTRLSASSPTMPTTTPTSASGLSQSGGLHRCLCSEPGQHQPIAPQGCAA